VLSLALTAQEKIYYNSDWKSVPSAETATYYAEVVRDKDSVNRAKVSWYFISGKKYSEKSYSDYEKGTLEGKLISWFENGQVKVEGMIVNGAFEGELKTYFENGQLKRDDKYAAGKLVSGTCFNRDGKEIPHTDYMIVASFPGGQPGWVNYLQSELKYPKKAIKGGIDGTVIVQFIVSKDGSISDISVNKSVSKELDAEAVRVISVMPNWKPGREDGELVRSYFKQPITFKIER